MKTVALAAIAVCALMTAPWPAGADVTISITTKGPMGDAPSVMYIRGTKARQDTTLGNRQISSIVDPVARQMIVLDPQTKEATIIDLAKVASEMQQSARPEDTKVSLTPTGETRQLLGRTCTGYMLSLTFTASAPAPTQGAPKPGMAKITIGGPVWLAKDAPGTRDFAAFFNAAAESGLFFSPPGRGGAQESRSQALMYKAFADAGGIPYEQQIQVKIEGVQMQPPSVTMVVTSVSTDPIPDDKFQVPAGYAKRTQ